jgi:hypothetical protein
VIPLLVIVPKTNSLYKRSNDLEIKEKQKETFPVYQKREESTSKMEVSAEEETSTEENLIYSGVKIRAVQTSLGTTSTQTPYNSIKSTI